MTTTNGGTGGFTAYEMRRADILDEVDVLVTCKGYSERDAWKAAEQRVQPLAAYEARAAIARAEGEAS